MTVTQGIVEPIRIAIMDVQGTDSYLTQLGKEISDVITNDLSGSGLFRPLSKSSFIQKTISIDEKPKFSEWRILKAQSIAFGKITKDTQHNKFRVEIALYDINSERLMGKVAFTHSQVRRLGHKIADYIFTQLTGETGYFDTQIVYVTESGSGNAVVKQLALMDQDGRNQRMITYGKSLVMTPRFSPTARKIAYLDFGMKNIHPKVYILDPDTNKKELVGHFPGMTFAPRFSADGHNLVMSLAKNGNSHLYTFNNRTHYQRQLTFGNVIDTSPSYSPDGRQIAFNSNRGRNSQIYVIDANGQNMKRISYGEGIYRTPVWSPRGDLIAFIKMWNGSFYLGVMRPDGSGERLITQGYILDDPIWSVNGRMIMYSRQERSVVKGKSGKFHLNIIDLTGSNNRQIPTLNAAYSAAWSPLLP